jgi:hypothetical protein
MMIAILNKSMLQDLVLVPNIDCVWVLREPCNILSSADHSPADFIQKRSIHFHFQLIQTSRALGCEFRALQKSGRVLACPATLWVE